MKFADVLALRPAANDSASILAAIEKAEAAARAAISRAHELERQRTASLLTATDAEMEAAEREAAEARRGAERIGALLNEMQTALEAARRREAVEAVREQIEQANKLGEDFVAAWKAKYAKAASVIRDLLLMEAASVKADQQAREAIEEARSRGITDALPELAHARSALFGPNRIMGDAIQLPGPAGELHWHPDAGCFWFQPHQAPRRAW